MSRRTRAMREASQFRRRRWLYEQIMVCHYCNRNLVSTKPSEWRRFITKPTVDHATPLSRGGKDEPSNWRVCCKKCNQAKGNLTELEFAARKINAQNNARKKEFAQ